MYKSNDFLRQLVLVLVTAALAFPLLAEEKEAGDELIRQNLQKTLPGLEVGEIASSPVPGLYEVVVGDSVVYATADGRYLLQGSLLDLVEQKNLTEPRMNGIKAEAIAKVSEENMVIFGPKDAKHTVTVFSDIDCGYCRKLHNEMDSYNEAGIRIRYLFYPRAGVNSESYKKAVSVWCADDRNQAMTTAKLGKPVEEKDCANPVQSHMQLGENVGVTGTPALVLENGKLIPGYIPANRLTAIIEQQSNP